MLERSDYKLAQPGQPTMVLVEDNPADVMLVREALQWHGVNPALLVLRDGDEAIRFVDGIDEGELPGPDLIVLDINLPRKSGFEVLARVRSSQKCAEKPVVVMSSSDSRRDREQAERLGASYYIPKPSTLKEFDLVGAKLKGLLAGRVGLTGTDG